MSINKINILKIIKTIIKQNLEDSKLINRKKKISLK